LDVSQNQKVEIRNRKKFDYLLIENLVREKDSSLLDPKKLKVLPESVFVTDDGKVCNLLKLKVKKHDYFPGV